MPRKPSASDQPSSSRGVTSRVAKRTQNNSYDESDSGEYSRPLRKTVDRKPSTGSRTSRARKPRQIRTSSDESDDNRTALSQSTKPTQAVDQKTSVDNMVKTLLNLSATKHIIKRQGDAEVFKLCKEQLKEIYGLEVSEVGTSSSKGWIVYSGLTAGVTSLQFLSENRREITFLFIILSYIFMKGGEVQEGENYLLPQNID